MRKSKKKLRPITWPPTPAPFVRSHTKKKKVIGEPPWHLIEVVRDYPFFVYFSKTVHPGNYFVAYNEAYELAKELNQNRLLSLYLRLKERS